MWIYYFVSYGPGHQGQDDDFISFPDDTDTESIKATIFDRYHHHDSVILSFWQVKTLPDNFVNEKIKDAENSIKYLKKTIQMLKKQEFFNTEQPKEADETVKKNLRHTIDKDVIYRLHKAGFMYKHGDVTNWYFGKTKPPKEHRTKILSIIRRSKKYPS